MFRNGCRRQRRFPSAGDEWHAGIRRFQLYAATVCRVSSNDSARLRRVKADDRRVRACVRVNDLGEPLETRTG